MIWFSGRFVGRSNRDVIGFSRHHAQYPQQVADALLPFLAKVSNA
jgi:hypothetical protein